MLDLNYTLVVQIALFVALWLALKRLWFEPAQALLRERTRRSEGQIEAARKLGVEIDRLSREHHAALEKARSEAQREVAEVIRRAEAEQKELIAAATDDAQHTLADVRARVAEEVATARRNLSADVGAIAREVARRVMGRTV